MKNIIRKGSAIAVSIFALSAGSTSFAAESVNVAFFLEWASPNQISKVDKVYDEAMGVDVNWTDFSTGVQMTEAMLAGILIFLILKVYLRLLLQSNRAIH